MTRTSQEVVTIVRFAARQRKQRHSWFWTTWHAQKLTNSSMPIRTAPKARTIPEYTCRSNVLVIVILLCCYKSKTINTIIIVCVVFLLRKCLQSKITAWLMLYHMLNTRLAICLKPACSKRKTHIWNMHKCVLDSFRGSSVKIGNDTEKTSMAPAQGWHA